jgi:hypothetical protein
MLLALLLVLRGCRLFGSKSFGSYDAEISINQTGQDKLKVTNSLIQIARVVATLALLSAAA